MLVRGSLVGEVFGLVTDSVLMTEIQEFQLSDVKLEI